MDSFGIKRGLVCVVLALLPGLLLAQADRQPLTIAIDAESSSLDRLTNRGSFRKLKITIEQEEIGIEADEALVAGLDSDSSLWQFAGNVRMTIATAVLLADTATFTFGNNQLIVGELTGSPASFQDEATENEDLVIGSASRIYYDSVAGTVRMEGDVALTAGPNRITGCDVIYDLNQERVSSGTSDCGAPFRITIIPPAEDTSTSEPPAP